MFCRRAECAGKCLSKKIIEMVSTKTDAKGIDLNNKEILTSEEAARYMGFSMSYLYKLTMQHKIPHYKPMGKMCYFNRKELIEWLQSNKVSTATEIEQQAQAYCMKKGGVL